MISQEFRTAVANKNLLRTRIMLKDSFVVDPTFVLLEEMLTYARQKLPDLIVPFDDDVLEEDASKWNQEIMNMELVQLVNNFSETRILHLQKVVSKVMEVEIEKIKKRKMQPEYNNQCSRQTSSSILGQSPISVHTPEEIRRQALRKIMSDGTKITNVLQKVKTTKKWELSQINELEKAARQILQATETYKANR